MRRTIEIAAFAIAVLIAALAIHAWLTSRDDQRRLQSTLDTQKQLIDDAGARETARDSTLQQTLAQIDALKRATQTPAEILRELPKYLALPAPIALASPAAAAVAQHGAVHSTEREPERATGRAMGRAMDLAADKQQGTDSSRESPSAPSPASSLAFSAFPTVPASPPDAFSPESTSLGLATSPSAPSNTSSSSTSPAASAEIPAADLKPLYDYVQDCRACQARLAAATQNAADEASKIAALTRERDAAVTASKGGNFWQRFRRNALWLAVGAGLGYAAHR